MSRMVLLASCPQRLALACTAIFAVSCCSKAPDPSSTPERSAPQQRAGVQGWLSWRGPQQNGTSSEEGLPDKVAIDGRGSWNYVLKGRGTPVIADGKVFTMGYAGTGKELQEKLVCLDATSGKLLWEHRFTDFISDIIYHRFAIGSPTIDQQTGKVYCMSTAGLLNSFTADGELRWQKSLMSEYGRLTFPNGRTGAPLLVDGLCIVHVISSAWGAHGPARDRFLAFDMHTGESIWSSTPGGPPKDSSFSFPYVAEEHGKLVMYAGLGGGYLVCVDVRTGDPIWRFKMAIGGLNCSPVVYKDHVIAIHGKENIDSSVIGRMISIKRGSHPGKGEKGPRELAIKTHEGWRNDLVAFTSSPLLVGDRVYETDAHGELSCIDAATGKILWHEKLAPDQIHASPAWGDGKLYVPMNNGTFFIIEPSDKGPKVLQKLQLKGNCVGAPAIANGRIYVHTTDRLYSFAGGKGGSKPGFVLPKCPLLSEATRLQVVPGDVVVRQGDAVKYRARSLSRHGLVAKEDTADVTWSGLTATGVSMSGGSLKVADDASPGAMMVKASAKGLQGLGRLRVVPKIPFQVDFNNVKLAPHPKQPDLMRGRPPAHWLSAGPKWEVLKLDGEQVLARTLTNPLFQRTMCLIGHPDQKGYTSQVDIRTDGNRRSMSSAGLVNQRYLIVLKGNHQTLEVSSNMELLKESVRYRWKAKQWYTLKTRVDVKANGDGVIRAKVWPRGDKEPEAWTLEVKHPNAHTHGSPGVYGFTPQSRFRVYH
ncbi:MAG: PQQ-binding-like beta-propeller repeat protein [Planctomycetota bacterium]|nr:PQQ-binding-like beta-propeller repeat protein [Planctomycetota bacterium]